MMRKKPALAKPALIFIFACACLIIPGYFATAQEEMSREEITPPVEIQVLSAEQIRIGRDISTSSLLELAAWCRSLGLSEGGTSADLAGRLRDYFKITSAGAPSGTDNRKIITVESARNTEYFRVDAVNEEYARLTGSVELSLKDGEAIHKIKAWDILFNKTRNIITASGGVEYIKQEGDKIETFRGDSITVNIDNWESIFLGGISERSLQGDATTYKFAGTVMTRDEEDVTILNRASISSANKAESYWSLNASQVWLLPGSDFAIFNALLKVGEIPVLYIPFFYYPADEMVFHPVVGFRTREGNFVQTTTYILGRPQATSSSQSSLTRILGNSNDMEKQREGLFLRSTGKKKVDASKTTLTAMADYYSNLGGFLGADLRLPAKGIFGASDISLGLGFSRTIAQYSGSYSPFWPTYDGETDWNWSNLFSMDVPFRYRFKGSSSLTGKFGSFTFSIPFYSDPYMESDFINNRSTEMDWINMIQQGAAAMETESSTLSQVGAPNWSFSGNINLKMPTIDPYVSTFNLNAISSSISFTTIQTPYPANDIKSYSPSRYFFAPNNANLYQISGSISGKPLSLGNKTTAQNASKANEKTPENPLANIGVPRSPFEEKEAAETKKNTDTDKLVPPVLNQRFDLPRSGNLQFSMDYRFNPSSASALAFNYRKWKEYSDVDWSDVSNIITSFTGTASTQLSMSHTSGLFTNSFSYGGEGTWRQLSYINEEAEEYLTAPGSGATDPAKVAEEKRKTYAGSFFNTTYDYSGTLKPLYWNSIFSNSSLQYSLRGLAIRNEFSGTGDEPDWDVIYGEWNKAKVFNHAFTGNISANVFDKSQSISVSSNLPPMDPSLTWNANFNVWITSTRAGMTIKFPGEPDRRELGDFTLNESVNFGTFGSFTHTLALDCEKAELKSLNFTLALPKWGISSITYNASRMRGYEWNPTPPGGASPKWMEKTDDEVLQSNYFSMNFSKNFIYRELWNKRMNISLTLNSRLHFDLQRYTSSSFTFGVTYTMGISNFLDLTLSTNSENPYIYRYFRNWWFFNDAPIEILEGNQNNLFLDLINSFRFDDESLRKMSGFKMKRFSVSATHYLGDWTATLTWSVAPYKKNAQSAPEMNNDVSFMLQWIPISEIKSNIKYNKQNSPEWQVQGL